MFSFCKDCRFHRKSQTYFTASWYSFIFFVLQFLVQCCCIYFSQSWFCGVTIAFTDVVNFVIISLHSVAKVFFVSLDKWYHLHSSWNVECFEPVSGEVHSHWSNLEMFLLQHLLLWTLYTCLGFSSGSFHIISR